MEDKLDKLSEAVFEMARLEEHLLTVFKCLKHMDTPFKMYDGLVDEIEKQVLIRGQKIASSKRLFWMVVTGAVGIAFVSSEIVGGGQTSSFVGFKEISLSKTIPAHSWRRGYKPHQNHYPKFVLMS